MTFCFCICFFTDSVSEAWLEKLLKIRLCIEYADWISMQLQNLLKVLRWFLKRWLRMLGLMQWRSYLLYMLNMHLVIAKWVLTWRKVFVRMSQPCVSGTSTSLSKLVLIVLSPIKLLSKTCVGYCSSDAWCLMVCLCERKKERRVFLVLPAL